jgi:hypothetical protein
MLQLVFAVKRLWLAIESLISSIVDGLQTRPVSGACFSFGSLQAVQCFLCLTIATSAVVWSFDLRNSSKYKEKRYKILHIQQKALPHISIANRRLAATRIRIRGSQALRSHPSLHTGRRFDKKTTWLLRIRSTMTSPRVGSTIQSRISVEDPKGPVQPYRLLHLLLLIELRYT